MSIVICVEENLQGRPLAGPFNTEEEALAAAVELCKDSPEERLIVEHENGVLNHIARA